MNTFYTRFLKLFHHTWLFATLAAQGGKIKNQSLKDLLDQTLRLRINQAIITKHCKK